MGTRCILYARVSSDDSKKDGRNLASQLDMCRAYAVERGYTIVEEINEDDKGASGASFELPGLARALELIAQNKAGVLVVRELDRLSRNLAKQLIVEEELKRCGGRVEYVIESYDDSPEGQLGKLVKASVAEYERLKIRERMTRGKRNRAKSGKVLCGSSSPYGYQFSEDGTTLVINEQEAETIRLMYQWYVYGDETGARLATAGIASKLNALQIPTWVELHGDRASGALAQQRRDKPQWIAPTVRRMLKSPLYAGVWRYGKAGNNPIEVPVPPIIDRETWNAVQAQRARNANTAKRNTKHDYLMQYRLECGCGYSVIAKAYPSRESCRYYYLCVCMHHGHDFVNGKCGLPYFKTDHVDGLVWHWLKGWLADPDKLDGKLDEFQRAQESENAPVLALIRSADNLLSTNKAKLGRLLDLYLDGGLDKETYTGRKVQLEETIASLEAEKAELQSRLAFVLDDSTISELKTFAEMMRDGLLEADENFDARRRIIELLDVRGKLAVEDGEKVVYVWFSLDPKGGRLTMPGRGKKLSFEDTTSCVIIATQSQTYAQSLYLRHHMGTSPSCEGGKVGRQRKS